MYNCIICPKWGWYANRRGSCDLLTNHLRCLRISLSITFMIPEISATGLQSFSATGSQAVGLSEGAGSGCRGGAGVLHTAFSTLGPMSSGSTVLHVLSFSTIFSHDWLCWLVWLTGGVVVSGAVMQGGMEGDGGQSDGGLLEECGGVRGAQIVWCDDVWAGGGGVKPVVLTRLLYAHQSFTPTFSDFSQPSPHVPVVSAPTSFSRSRSSIKSL